MLACDARGIGIDGKRGNEEQGKQKRAHDGEFLDRCGTMIFPRFRRHDNDMCCIRQRNNRHRDSRPMT